MRRTAWRRVLASPLIVLIFAVSSIEGWEEMMGRSSLSPRIASALGWVRPLRSINGYGLFRVMTTSRPEIIIEGSDDGRTWKTYEFRYKPGDLNVAPRWVAPHQPRLDWQMWFAALSAPQRPPWFMRFCQKLLEGSPEVLALLDKNPFPARPPKLLRAQLYDYQFTTAAERSASGAWWKREFMGMYVPPVSLRR